MAAEAKKPKAKVQTPKRKKPRKRRTVTFNLENFEGDFVLPDVKFLTQKEQWALKSGRIERIRTELVGDDIADIIEDLDDEEMKAFADAWFSASGVDQGE